jgi:class 3 adenylate cyclase
MPVSKQIQKHPCPPGSLPHHRSIIAVDIELSTSRTNPVKAELRRTVYELFDTALRSAGIQESHRDRFIDRGDGILALIHPVDQAPKALLLTRAIPALRRLLSRRNRSLLLTNQLQRQLRLRVVIHAGEVHYDTNGSFGEALDLAFRLLDSAQVKKALRATGDPIALVVSEDIYNSVICHGYDGIDQRAFRPHVRVQIAGHRRTGWIHIPGEDTSPDVTANDQLPAALDVNPAHRNT